MGQEMKKQEKAEKAQGASQSQPGHCTSTNSLQRDCEGKDGPTEHKGEDGKISLICTLCKSPWDERPKLSKAELDKIAADAEVWAEAELRCSECKGKGWHPTGDAWSFVPYFEAVVKAKDLVPDDMDGALNKFKTDVVQKLEKTIAVIPESEQSMDPGFYQIMNIETTQRGGKAITNVEHMREQLRETRELYTKLNGKKAELKNINPPIEMNRTDEILALYREGVGDTKDWQEIFGFLSKFVTEVEDAERKVKTDRENEKTKALKQASRLKQERFQKEIKEKRKKARAKRKRTVQKEITSTGCKTSGFSKDDTLPKEEASQ